MRTEFKLVYEYISEEPQTIKQFIFKKDLPRKFMSSVKHSGGKILLNNDEVTVRANLSKGDILTIIPPIEEGHETIPSSSVPIEIIYEDRDILVINKPENVISIPSRRTPDVSIANRIKGYYERQNYLNKVIHIVTRLDRNTTGLMLIAKHRLAHALLDRQIRQGEIERYYYAITHNAKWEDHGIIDAPIARCKDSIITRQVHSSGKPSKTEYWLEERYKDSALLRLQLHTGRTHQIRVHLSYALAPLVGDDLYGGVIDNLLKRQALHCGELRLKHPFTQELLIIQQKLPRDMQEWIEMNR